MTSVLPYAEMKMASGTIKNSEVGELVEFTGTNCKGVYMRLGRFVLVHFWKNVTEAILPLPLISGNLCDNSLAYGFGVAMRDTSVGGSFTAEVWISGGGLLVKGGTNGHSHVGSFIYVTDD